MLGFSDYFLVILTTFITSVIITTFCIDHTRDNKAKNDNKYNNKNKDIIDDKFKHNPKEGIVYMFDSIKPVFDSLNLDYYMGLLLSVPRHIPIKLIISTKGGSVAQCNVLFNCLRKHEAGYDVYIYDICMSAGTWLAFGAKTIIMNNYSYMTKSDTCYNNILCCNSKNMQNIILNNKIKSSMSEMQDLHIAQKIQKSDNQHLAKLFKDKKVLEKIKNRFIYGNSFHSDPIYYEDCLEVGLNVRKPVDDEKIFFKYQSA